MHLGALWFMLPVLCCALMLRVLQFSAGRLLYARTMRCRGRRLLCGNAYIAKTRDAHAHVGVSDRNGVAVQVQERRATTLSMAEVCARNVRVG